MCAVFVLILVTSLPAVQTGSGFAKDHKFVPPDVTNAGNIPYPIDAMVYGIVTLTVNLNAAGQIQNVQVLRDIPPLTDAAVTAVNNWMFKAGTLDGSPVISSLNVSVVFNPGNAQGQNLTLPPVNLSPPTNPPGYLPAEIAAATYASYPVDSVATGSVVLDVIIDRSNDIKKVIPIHAVPSLTSQATSALQGWTINSATYQGKAVKSNVIIAFVFRSPTISSP